MMVERKVLGKGLDALIPKKPDMVAAKDFIYVSLDKVKAGAYQPRQEIDERELKELSQSIKEKGVIQPIVIRKSGIEDYEIVAGGRRYQAAKLLGLREIPAIIKELDDKDTLIFAIVENLQRKDLNPIEEADAFMRLMEEFDFSQDDIARFVGKDKTTIVNTLRLLKLPNQIKLAVKKGILSRSQARTILGAQSIQEQEKIFDEIVNEKLSVREIERRVKKVSRKKNSIDTFTLEAEEGLQKALGTKVRIFNKRNNRGRIVIEYYNLEDLDRIMKKISGSVK